MTPPEALPLVEQRQALREKILAQRELIAIQLSPQPTVESGYPRSKTMRFLARQPGLAVALLAESAAFLVGARYAKSMPAVMALARIIRSAATRKRGGPTA